MSLLYLLDTNIISEPLKAQPNQHVIDNIERYFDQIAIAAMVYYELVRGVELLPDSKRRIKTQDYIESVIMSLPILPYTDEAAIWHGKTSARLQQKGKIPPFVDTQIASVAKVNNLILVTRNLKDFDHLTELSIENWFLHT